MRELRPTYTRSSLRSGTAPRRPPAGCRQPSPRRMPLSCTGTAVTVAKRCVDKKKKRTKVCALVFALASFAHLYGSEFLDEASLHTLDKKWRPSTYVASGCSWSRCPG